MNRRHLWFIGQTYREHQREIRRKLVLLAGATWAGDWIAFIFDACPDPAVLKRAREETVRSAVLYNVRIPRSLRRFVPKDET